MKLSRLFTKEVTARSSAAAFGPRAFAGVEFERRGSRITNPDGTVVFEASDIEVPQGWSQVAVDIMAQKYFRKAGVPTRLRRVPEEGEPERLWRSETAGAVLTRVEPEQRSCRARDNRQR